MEIAALGIGATELLILLLIPLSLAFWIWMIIDCANREEPNSKVVWVLVIALLGILGGFIYFFARKLPRKKTRSPWANDITAK